MAEAGRLTPADYDPLRVATPLQLLQLMHRLGVSGRVIARQVGVKPAAISMWAREKRPIPERYGPIFRDRAQQVLDEAAERNRKDMDLQPTDALRQMVQDEFTGIWARWKAEVLYAAGTLHQAIRHQYEALAGWVLKEYYNAEDIESVQLAMEAMVAHMKRVLALQDKAPDPEQALLDRLMRAHDAAQQTRK